VREKIPHTTILTLTCGAKHSCPSAGAGEKRSTRSPDAHCPPSTTVRIDGRAPKR